MGRVQAPASPLDIRRAEPADRPAILDLMVSSLGWARDERHDALFRWKHDENPFGPSPAWVAVEGDRVLGLRTFMRWAFRFRGETIAAVRAVDTATHPDARGRGVFRDLTMGAIDDLRAEGIDWIFNTPNDQSRPGYLKMGWHEVGRLPLALRPQLAPSRLLAAFRNRSAHADLWPVDGADDDRVAVLLEEGAALGDLLAEAAANAPVQTDRSVAYLAWRYGLAPLGYRAFAHPKGIERGFVIVRVRRRGTARELSVCELVVRDGDTAAARNLLQMAARATRPDFAAGIGSVPSMLRLPDRGPILTARDVSAAPPTALPEWNLGLGDVELF